MATMAQLGRWPRWRMLRGLAIGGAVALVVVSSAVNLATFWSDRAAPAPSDLSVVTQEPVAGATTATQNDAASAQTGQPAAAGASAAQTSDVGPLAVAPSDQIYVVQAGDTLHKIAVAYNTTIPAIVEENGISDPDRVHVGQVLTIPAPPP